VATGPEVLKAVRRDHVVLFYRGEQELTERVSEYLLPAVQDGGVAIVVATADHRRSFETRLADTGVDVAAARARGCYLALDARETMRGFMVADWPDTTVIVLSLKAVPWATTAMGAGPLSWRSKVR